MDVPKETGAGRDSDSEVDRDEAKKNIFSFKSLQIDDSINPKECSAENSEDHNLKRTGKFKPQANMSPRRNIFDTSKPLREMFLNKDGDTESSFKGNWTLYCNPSLDCNGNSEAIEIQKSAQELHQTRPELFPIPPYSCEKQNGTVVVCCYTPDYTDKDFNLRVARVIREEIHYPYVMYYHKRIGNLTSFYMHTPDDEFYVNNEGAWILEE